MTNVNSPQFNFSANVIGAVAACLAFLSLALRFYTSCLPRNQFKRLDKVFLSTSALLLQAVEEGSVPWSRQVVFQERMTRLHTDVGIHRGRVHQITSAFHDNREMFRGLSFRIMRTGRKIRALRADIVVAQETHVPIDLAELARPDIQDHLGRPPSPPPELLLPVSMGSAVSIVVTRPRAPQEEGAPQDPTTPAGSDEESEPLLGRHLTQEALINFGNEARAHVNETSSAVASSPERPRWTSPIMTPAVPDSIPAVPFGHFRGQLNTLLQLNGQHVAWSYAASGPHHAPMWTCTAKINGVDRGRGTMPTKAEAQEEAARQACLEYAHTQAF